MHFSEIIKLQFDKKKTYIALYFGTFGIIISQLPLKDAWLPQFSFWNQIALATISFSKIIVINCAKIP